MDFIPINKPVVGEEEKKAVISVLDSGMLVNSSYEGGEIVRKFEGKIQSLLGAKHVIAVNSGTAALYCSMLALDVGPGDEVIVPSFTFLATANVVLACGAKPVFVDSKEDYNIDPESVRRAITKKTKAIIPVHLYGYPADMDEINELASKRSLGVVEDAAESLGAEYKGKQTGTISSIGCFSFYSTKVVTSGEGGAISTNDDALADRLRLARNHGQVRGYDSRRLGFNYRMQEMAAALGSAQMQKHQDFVRIRRKNAKYLNERISKLDGVRFTQNQEDRTHVFYLYTLFLRNKRDRILGLLNHKGIGAAVYFKLPVHRTPLYQDLGYDRLKLKNAESASRHVLSLPVHPSLTESDLKRVADTFVSALKLL